MSRRCLQIFLALCFAWPVVTNAQTDLQFTTSSVPAAVIAIRRAKNLLSPAVRAPFTLNNDPKNHRRVLLALWDNQTEDIIMVTGSKQGTRISLENPDLIAKLVSGQGYASIYAIDPPRWRVAAVVYGLVESSQHKKRTTWPVQDIVYAPGGSSWQTDDVQNWGRHLLDSLVTSTIAKLRVQQVASHAFPGDLLADHVDPVVMKSIMIIEHLDQYSVSRGADHRLDFFFTELGLNELAAFSVARSSAGAHGWLQFLPATYERIRRRWPELSLPKDFTQASRDPQIMLLAQAAYLDDVWSELPDVTRDVRITNPETMRAYLVAAYNAGGVRVRRALQAWGENWDQDRRALQLTAEAQALTAEREVKRLKKKLVQTKGKEKSQITKELTKWRDKQVSAVAQASALDKSRLKAETLGYLQKYRLIAPRIKAELLVDITGAVMSSVVSSIPDSP